VGHPKFWIVGGPNGAGKTTLAKEPRFQRLLRGVRFFNPDEVALERLRVVGRSGFHEATPSELRRWFIDAAEAVETELKAGLSRGEALGVESVLSTRKYCPLVEQVLAASGFFGLIYVALKSPELSRERVARRVLQGGHDVPAEKLDARWSKSIANLGWFARHASRFWIVDNSDSTPEIGPRLIVHGGKGQVNIVDPEAIPEITRSLKGSAHS
jgi:predicted ABC-type ATPase